VGLLAHQGGWDEILLILGPMAVVVLLLRLAKRRVEANLPPLPTAPDAPPGDRPPADDPLGDSTDGTATGDRSAG
jgi:hypothetical protein